MLRRAKAGRARSCSNKTMRRGDAGLADRATGRTPGPARRRKRRDREHAVRLRSRDRQPLRDRMRSPDQCRWRGDGASRRCAGTPHRWRGPARRDAGGGAQARRVQGHQGPDADAGRALRAGGGTGNAGDRDQKPVRRRPARGAARRAGAAKLPRAGGADVVRPRAYYGAARPRARLASRPGRMAAGPDARKKPFDGRRREIRAASLVGAAAIPGLSSVGPAFAGARLRAQCAGPAAADLDGAHARGPAPCRRSTPTRSFSKASGLEGPRFEATPGAYGRCRHEHRGVGDPCDHLSLSPPAS